MLQDMLIYSVCLKQNAKKNISHMISCPKKVQFFLKEDLHEKVLTKLSSFYLPKKASWLRKENDEMSSSMIK